MYIMEQDVSSLTLLLNVVRFPHVLLTVTCKALGEHTATLRFLVLTGDLIVAEFLIRSH